MTHPLCSSDAPSISSAYRRSRRFSVHSSGVLAAACLALLILCSCSTQYIPIETVRTEYQNHTDTIREKDTVQTTVNTVIREADSALVASLGLKLQDNERAILILRNELQRVIKDKQQHSTDTIIKTDSVQVPYPVPAQLTRWQSFCCDYGKIMVGTTVTLIIAIAVILLLYFKRKRFSHTT